MYTNGQNPSLLDKGINTSIGATETYEERPRSGWCTVLRVDVPLSKLLGHKVLQKMLFGLESKFSKIGSPMGINKPGRSSTAILDPLPTWNANVGYQSTFPTWPPWN